MINDYPELIAEVTYRSQISGVANRAKMYVGLAENYLSKKLRLGGMETSAELTTDANGDAALPSDFQEMRSVIIGDWQLKKRPLTSILQDEQCGYAVQGSTLKSYYSDTLHKIVYYASIPSLEANNTNYLLEGEPEMYLQAVLFQAYAGAGKLDQAAIIKAYLDGLIKEANKADYMRRRAGTRINLGVRDNLNDY